MALVFNGRGGGGSAFNGGTITQELVVDTGGGTGQALELQGSRTSQNDAFRIDYPHTVVIVDSDGVATFTSDDNMALKVQGTGDSGSKVLVTNAPTSFAADLVVSATGARLDAIAGSNTVAGISTFTGLTTSLNAAPADGLFNAGTACIWLDQTNGAAKLMVKAKQADGTVVTAAIALA